MGSIEASNDQPDDPAIERLESELKNLDGLDRAPLLALLLVELVDAGRSSDADALIAASVPAWRAWVENELQKDRNEIDRVALMHIALARSYFTWPKEGARSILALWMRCLAIEQAGSSPQEIGLTASEAGRFCDELVTVLDWIESPPHGEPRPTPPDLTAADLPEIYATGISYFEIAIDAYRSAGLGELVADTYLAKARLEQVGADPWTPLAYEETIDAYANVGDMRSVAETQVELARLYELKDHEFDYLFDDDPNGTESQYRFIADKMLGYLRSALAIFRGLGDSDSGIQCVVDIAHVYGWVLGDPVQGTEFLETAVEEIGQDELLRDPRQTLVLARTFEMFGAHNRAIELASEVREPLTEMGFGRVVGSILQVNGSESALDSPSVGSSAASIRRLIAAGESESVEFKSSARIDIKTGKLGKYVEESFLKTIAGMMNANGGTLLVGVADDGSIVGMNADLKTVKGKNADGFKNWVADVLHNAIGVWPATVVVLTFHELDGGLVLEVEIPRGDEPTFVCHGQFDEEFFVRVQSTTRCLNKRELVDYKQRRWPPADRA